MSVGVRSWWITTALWATTSVCVTAAYSGWRSALASPAVQRTQQMVVVPDPALLSADTLRVATAELVARDPFRADRHPSSVAFRTDVQGIAPPPKPPRPALSLAGIIGGPPWEALLDGLPGKEGSTLVRKGDVIDGFKIRSVSRDSVIVQAADTTWRLAVKAPWQ